MHRVLVMPGGLNFFRRHPLATATAPMERFFSFLCAGGWVGGAVLSGCNLFRKVCGIYGGKMHRSDLWWEALGSLWKLGCITDRMLCRELRVDRESFRMQRHRRGWQKDIETTLDEQRKAIAEQEEREWRNRWLKSHISEGMQLRFEERKAEFDARLAYLKTLSLT